MAPDSPTFFADPGDTNLEEDDQAELEGGDGQVGANDSPGGQAAPEGRDGQVGANDSHGEDRPAGTNDGDVEDLVLRKLDTLLPPDVPLDHRAHSVVRWDIRLAGDRPTQGCFWELKRAPERIKFFVSLAQVRGSTAAAERLARAAFIMFEEGATKDQLVEFRSQIYQKVKAGEEGVQALEVGHAADDPKPDDDNEAAAPSAAAPSAAETAASSERSGGEGASAATLPDGLSSELDSVLPADAPPGHRSHYMVKTRFDTPGGRCVFEHCNQGVKVNLQVTSSCLRKSLPAAQRLARACYFLLDQGGTKEEVLELRRVTYEKAKLIGDAGLNPNAGSPKAKAEDAAAAAAASSATTAAASAALPREAPAAWRGASASAAVAAATTSATASTAAEGPAAVAAAVATAAAPAPSGTTAAASAQPSASGIPAWIEECLPPDAPPGHRAHMLVRVMDEGKASDGSSRAACAKFEVRRGGEGKLKFQVSVPLVGNSVLAAMHTARALCFMVDDGMDVDEIKEARKDCYTKVKAASHLAEDDAKRGNNSSAGAAPDTAGTTAREGSATCAATTKAQEPASSKWPVGALAVASGSATVADAAAQGGTNGSDAILEAVKKALPPGSPLPETAISKGRWREDKREDGLQNNRCVANPKHPTLGKMHWQVKLLDVGGSTDAAEYVCNVCVAMLEEGKPKQEVDDIRRVCIEMAQALAPNKESGAPKEVRVSLKRVASRDDTMPPSHSASAEATPGLELLDPLPASFQQTSEIKWTHKPSARSSFFYYRFTDKADGSVKQVQVTLGAVNGWKELAYRIMCLCYLKIKAGATKDEAMECRQDLYNKVSGVPVCGQDQALHVVGVAHSVGVADQRSKSGHDEEGAPKSKSQKKAERGQEDGQKQASSSRKRSSELHSTSKKKAARKEAANSEDSNSDSDESNSSSDASSSASSEGSGGGAADAKAAMRPTPGPPQEPKQDPKQAAATAPRPPLPPQPPPGHRVVAKMLCKTGVRCACHFMYTASCPNRAGEAKKPQIEAKKPQTIEAKKPQVEAKKPQEQLPAPARQEQLPAPKIPDPTTPQEWALMQDKLFAGMPSLKKGWIRLRSKSRGDLLYYYNMETGDSQLEAPLK